MSRNATIFFFLVFAILSFCYSQKNEEVQNIINLKISIEIRQQKIDSFINFNNNIDSIILANCYHDLGGKWYYKVKWKSSGNQNDLKEAIYYTRKALNLKKAIKLTDTTSLKKTLYNLGFFYSKNSNFFNAITAYSELIELRNEDLRTYSAQQELGDAYNNIGDYHKALMCYNKLESVYKNDSIKRRKLIDIYIKKARTYSLMGFREFSDQIRFNLEKIDSILEKTKIKNDRIENEINQIEGNRLIRIEKYKDAIPYHDKVLQNLNITDSLALAVVYNSIAVSYLKLEKVDLAYSNLQKSILYNKSYTDPYENLGDLYIAKKNFKKAFYNYQKAIIYSFDKEKEIVFDAIPEIKELRLTSNKNSLLGHIIRKANAWIGYYEFDGNKDHLIQALKTFELADQLVDVIRFESTEFQSKLFWREKGASLYIKAVKVCFLLNKPKDAFRFMERNKALLLLEDITNEEAKEIVKLPIEIAKREFNLKRNIFLTENELQNRADKNKDSIVIQKDRISKHKHSYEKFVDSLAQVYPDYARFKKKVAVIDYDAFATKYTGKDEVVIHYILNKNQGYGLLSSQDQILLFPIEGITQLHKDIHIIQDNLYNGVLNKNQFFKTSHLVFKKLIPDEVYAIIKDKKLTIIPDYTLQQVPFETLVVDPTDLRYLIEDVEIKYEYSITHLDRITQVKNNSEKEFLGVGIVNFSNLGLSELLYSEDELRDVREIYSGDVLFGKEASKSNFMHNAKDHKIIHLSTHADLGSNGNPWIAFNDEKLFLKEIYATKIPCDMVVLGACNTSRGDLKPGEGVMSLARGFFHSGAKSVVSSLWSINDKASKEIMVDFYKELDEGLTKSAALRKAKLNFLETNTENALSPNLWGALILIGDNDTIPSKGFVMHNWVLILTGTVLVLLLFYFIRKRT